MEIVFEVNGIHEVGGSIPPGSTSLRSFRELRLGKPPTRAAFLFLITTRRC
jgi:hypothetical protein